MSLVVVGGTVVDIIITNAPRLPAWPRHSEFTPANLVLLAEAPLVTLGGNGANAAYIAARCGASVDLQTNLGKDCFGAMARGWLTAAGCRVLDSVGNKRTGINMTAANARHARATFFYPGASPSLPQLRKIPPETTHFLVTGWPHPSFSAIDRCFRLLRHQGRFTAMDIGPFLGRPWPLKELKPLLASLSLLLANEYELNALTRSTDLATSLRRIRRCFDGHIVVKRGNRGALWLAESSPEQRHIPASRVRAVNTVGAGDSFNGALLAALCKQKEFAQALNYATKMAARVVASRHGVLGLTTP
jgi:ribokinase